jgi:hypothetical protein
MVKKIGQERIDQRDLCSFVDKPSLAAVTDHFLCHSEKSVELVSTPI